MDNGFIYSDDIQMVDDIAARNARATTLGMSDIPPETMFLALEDVWVNGIRVRLLACSCVSGVLECS